MATIVSLSKASELLGGKEAGFSLGMLRGLYRKADELGCAKCFTRLAGPKIYVNVDAKKLDR